MNVNKDRGFIDKVFSGIAHKYDLMNDAMSLGVHRIWKKKFVNIINIQQSYTFADVSCGTGDITLNIFKRHDCRLIDHAYLVDPSDEMLGLAKDKLLNNGVSTEKINFVPSTAEDLKLDAKLNFVTLSFGIRNFSNIELALQNLHASLNDDGTLYCMEFTPKVDSKMLNFIYDKYLTLALPKIGKYLAKDEISYQYLADSIKNFLQPDQMIDMLKNANFSEVECIKLSQGIAAIYIARK